MRANLKFFSVKNVYTLSLCYAITALLSENNVKVNSDNDGNYLETNPTRSHMSFIL